MRLLGRHNYTPAELKVLRVVFNELNGPKVPRVGETFKIPLFADLGECVVVTTEAKSESVVEQPVPVVTSDEIEEVVQAPPQQNCLAIGGSRRR